MLCCCGERSVLGICRTGRLLVGGVSDSDPKIHQSQNYLYVAPLSKTTSHTTSVFVQPNERHKVTAIPEWQRKNPGKVCTLQFALLTG